jgi:hypothetical protein
MENLLYLKAVLLTAVMQCYAVTSVYKFSLPPTEIHYLYGPLFPIRLPHDFAAPYAAYLQYVTQ